MEYPALYAAYAEYAERMYDESDDLVSVDMFTVPMDVDITRWPNGLCRDPFTR